MTRMGCATLARTRDLVLFLARCTSSTQCLARSRRLVKSVALGACCWLTLVCPGRTNHPPTPVSSPAEYACCATFFHYTLDNNYYRLFKDILIQGQCAGCHTAPFYLDHQMHDLHLERFLKGRARRGTNQDLYLRGIKDSPPYLHECRALRSGTRWSPSCSAQAHPSGEGGPRTRSIPSCCAPRTWPVDCRACHSKVAGASRRCRRSRQDLPINVIFTRRNDAG